MSEPDVGEEALGRLCELLGVEAGWKPRAGGFEWCLWGAAQRAWSEPASGPGGWPSWRLQLRTPALETFTGSSAQVDALAAERLAVSLGCVVRGAGAPARLELATSLDVRGSSVGWVLWLLAVAARAHAVQARRLSQSQRLREAGLAPGVNLEAETPGSLPAEGLLLPTVQPMDDAFRPADEMPKCVETLKAHAAAHAVRSQRGLTATLPFRAAEGLGSVLEVTIDARQEGLGTGLSAVVRTAAPALVPLALALAQNEREVGAGGRGDAVGGWWTDASGLVHSSFYPEAFRPKGLGVEIALACARRARELEEALAGQRHAPDAPDPISR